MKSIPSTRLPPATLLRLFTVALALICISHVPANANPIQGNLLNANDWTFSVVSTTLNGTAQINGTKGTCTPAPCAAPVVGVGPVDSAFSIIDPNNDGIHWIEDIDAPGAAISQTVATEAGQSYLIKFTFSVTTSSAARGDFYVGFNGDFFRPELPSPPPGVCQSSPGTPGLISGPPTLKEGQCFFPTTVDEVISDVATSSLTTLEFVGGCPGCNFVVSGDVSFAVSEPPNGSFFAFSVVLLLFAARRIRARQRTVVGC